MDGDVIERYVDIKRVSKYIYLSLLRLFMIGRVRENSRV